MNGWRKRLHLDGKEEGLWDIMRPFFFFFFTEKYFALLPTLEHLYQDHASLTVTVYYTEKFTDWSHSSAGKLICIFICPHYID